MSDDERDPRDEDPSSVALLEEAVMVASALFTVALFGFAVWKALSGAGAVAPAVAVTDSEVTPDGEVVYEIEVRNEGDVGLVSVTVDARCVSPPASLTVENVPAEGHRTASVVCPPDADGPQVSVTSWVRE